MAEETASPNYRSMPTIKWLAVGLGSMLVLNGIWKKFFRSSSLSNPKEHIFCLVDKTEEQSLYDTVFSTPTNVYKTVYKQLISTPDDEDVSIIIRTYGGSLVWCLKICEAIKNRTGTTRVYVQDYAFSAGSIIALCADELYLSKNGSLAPIDPQVSPLDVLSQVSLKNITDVMRHSIDECRKTVKEGYDNELEHYIGEISYYVNPKYNFEKVMEKMFHDPVNHEVLFFSRHLNEFGIEHLSWDGKLESVKEKFNENAQTRENNERENESDCVEKDEMTDTKVI